MEKSRIMRKTRKISAAMKGVSPSTMKMMNAIIPMIKEVKRRRKTGLSVVDHVDGESVCLEVMLEADRRCSSGEVSSSESSCESGV